MGTRLLAALAEKRPRRGGKMLSGWKNCRWMELVGIPNEEDSFLLLLLFATVDDCSFLWPHFLCFDERDDLLVFRALARVPREEVQVNSVIVDEEFINEEMCNVYWNWLIEKCSEESFHANMMKLSSSVIEIERRRRNNRKMVDVSAERN